MNNFLYKGTAIYGNRENISISNNITDDPMFADAANGDFCLTSSSPAIDAGIYDALYGDMDLDKKPRVEGSAVDCGAYEHQ